MRHHRPVVMLAALLGLMLSGQAFAGHHSKEAKNDPEEVTRAEQTLATFKKTDPGMDKFLKDSAGYVVFTTIGKGGVGIGGAHGTGILFENGKAMGRAKMNQVTAGLQLGGQSFSEVMFFETPQALADFKDGKFALSAQASAVALKAGAAATTKYNQGVAIFTAAKGGLMYEATVGGQKFKYEPFANPST